MSVTASEPGEGALARQFQETSLEGRLQRRQDDEEPQYVYEIHYNPVEVILPLSPSY